MYIERVRNRNSPPCVLLRRSYREGGKVRKETLLNVTDWPSEMVDNLRLVLKGGVVTGQPADAFEIVRSRPHGHVAAVLGTVRRTGLDGLLAARRCRERDLVLAMVVDRILEPGSKSATARHLAEETLCSTLGEVLEVSSADPDELYAAMDWLVKRQKRIENKLAKRHLADGTLVLYDVTTTYFEGQKCPLAHHGYSRDGKPDKPQIAIGLLCDPRGCPLAVEVFEGNISDPKTFPAQLRKVRQRFGIQRVVWVGDRGMITDAIIRDELRGKEGLDWITALRAPQIRDLVADKTLQLSLFDERDLAVITHPDYPGERLIACRNPSLAEERRRTREELLQATERELDHIVAATQREKRALKGQDKIGLRVGRVINRFGVAKHFVPDITDDGFAYQRNQTRIDAEAAVDGIYILRTSTPPEALCADHTVLAYKSLSRVERAFRSLKSVDLKVRPIYHHLTDRVRAHVFLCMLAYYVEWHMRQALAPLLFDDDDPDTARTLRTSVVSAAQRSPAAKRKAAHRRNAEDLPVQSFQDLLKNLATIVRDRCHPTVANIPPFDKTTLPTPLQQRALDLLHVRL